MGALPSGGPESGLFDPINIIPWYSRILDLLPIGGPESGIFDPLNNFPWYSEMLDLCPAPNSLLILNSVSVRFQL